MTHRPSIPKQFQMPKEELDAYREKLIKYVTSMAIFKDMYHRGIIDKADYAVTEAKIAEKYGIPKISIYRSSDPDDPYSFIKSDD